MPEIYVGDEECGFSDVATIFIKIKPHLQLESLLNLLILFKTPGGRKEELLRKLNTSQLAINDVLEHALMEWRSRLSNKATLTTLLLHLRDCNLISHAEALEKMYGIETQANCPDANHLPSYSLSSQATEHLHPINESLENCEGQPLKEETTSTEHHARSTTSKIATKNKTFIRQLKIFVLILLTLIVALFSYGVIKMVWDKFHQSSKAIVKTPSETSALEFKKKISKTNYEYGDQPSDAHVTSHCKMISVNSSNEYNELLDIETIECLLLSIYVNTSSHLNWLDSLSKSTKVTEVTLLGCIQPSLLQLILTQFTLVHKLTLIEIQQQSCECKQDLVSQHRLEQIQNTKFTLNNLVHIEFKDISLCSNVFRYFIQNITLLRLSIMKINNVVGYESIVLLIRKILILVRHSIEILHFVDVKWETSPFENINYIFPKLFELRIDLVPYKKNVVSLIGKMNHYAPNLKTLSSLDGFLPLNENNFILQMKKIEYLQYGIWIPMHVSQFNISVYVSLLPHLRYLDLYVWFENSKTCKIIGEGEVQQSINLTLLSCFV